MSVILLVGPMSTAVAAPDDGTSPKSMFLDLGGASAEEIAARVERICAAHRDPANDNYIMNVVLVGVVDPSGRPAGRPIDGGSPPCPWWQQDHLFRQRVHRSHQPRSDHGSLEKPA